MYRAYTTCGFSLVCIAACGRLGFDAVSNQAPPDAVAGTAIGVLDPTFEGSGVFLYNYVDDDGMSLDDQALGVAIDSKDRIVAVISGNYGFTVAGDQLDMATISLRLSADGQPDPTYQSGLLSIPGTTVDLSGSYSHGLDISIGADDAVTLCGFREWSGTDDPTLYRYLAASGERDPSLANTGIVNLSFAGETRCQGFARDPATGGYVVVGESGASLMFVAKARQSGAFDTTFGTNGSVIYDVAGSDVALDVVVDSGGRIYAVGSTTPSTSDLTVWRFLPNGTLDTSFSNDGIFTYDAGNNDGARAAALDPDEDLVVVGTATIAGSTVATALRISKATGELDPAFGTGGVFAHPTISAANGVIIDGAGSIYIAGTSELSGAVVAVDSPMTIWKLTPNGALDASFGSPGSPGVFTTLAGAGGTQNVGWDLVLDRAGRIVVAGESKNTAGYFDAAIWRIH